METDLKKIWENTLNIIKGEMSEVSFNTWIKSCEPISISSNTIIISVPNSFTQDILEKRYKDLVINSIEAALLESVRQRKRNNNSCGQQYACNHSVHRGEPPFAKSCIRRIIRSN